MKKWAYLTIIAAITACLLAGCSWTKTKRAVNKALDTEPTARPLYDEDDTPIIELNYDAADDIDDNLSKYLPAGSPIYIQKFTELDAPIAKNAFGTIVANQVAARLTQNGHTVASGPPKLPEKMEPAIQEEEKGFFEQMSEVEDPRPAVLTGSYVIGEDVIYVSGKITRLDDGTIAGSHDWTLPINKNTRELLPQLKQRGGLIPTVQTN